MFSRDVAQKHAANANYASKGKTQVPTTKLNSYSPAGLQLCSKTSANTTDEKKHTCIEKCFGNPPPSLFSPLVFYREEPGTGEWGQMVHKFSRIPLKARQTEY